MEDKEINKRIKLFYEDLEEVAKLKFPSGYFMPAAVYDAILKKLSLINDSLIDARKSRDIWKKRYQELLFKSTNNL